MAETLVNHNEYINHIDVKGDKIADGFAENQIKNKAKEYIEKKIQTGMSKEQLENLLKEIKQLLERQDVERIDFMTELKQKEVGETKEDVDKEALIHEAKTMIYEKLGIKETLKANSPMENFLKGAVDELVIGNYELAIDIWNTNGKIILDSLKQLATWEGIKKVAEGLGESIWNLFSGSAYEKGKSAAQLGLLSTVAGVGFAVGRKGVRAGMKEFSKFRTHKENIPTSHEVKGVVQETTRKVEEIVPKKQIDFEKLLVEDVKKLGTKERLEAGSFYLKGKKFTPEQEQAILKAHETGTPNKDGKFSVGDLRKKYIMLEKAGFNDNEIRTLMEKGVCGKEKLPSLGKTLLDDPKYDFLNHPRYKEFIELYGGKLDHDKLLGEGINGIILEHPTKKDKVIKIAKESKNGEYIDKLDDEFIHHSGFRAQLQDFRKEFKGTDKEKYFNKFNIPTITNFQGLHGVYEMQRIEGQNLRSMFYIKYYEKELQDIPKEQLNSINDNGVMELIRSRGLQELPKDSAEERILFKTEKGRDLVYAGDKHFDSHYWPIPHGGVLKPVLKEFAKKGFYHGDEHMGNFMVDKNGIIYMIDYGRSKIPESKKIK